MQETTKEKTIITVEEVKEKTTERFWSKIKFSELGECWEWIAALTSTGYGYFQLGRGAKGGTVLSHRYLYLILCRIERTTLMVLHKCDNPKCCNPNHLFLGTQKDNMQDMIAKGRDIHIPFQGSAHGMAKLNEEKVLEIRERLSKNESCVSLSKEFNVTPTMIRYIRDGKFWKHILKGAVQVKT